MAYIIALDIGVASVGWAVIDMETENVVEAGVNIFNSKTAAANKERRIFREGRRLTRRLRTRLDAFNKLWEDFGFVIPQKYSNKIVDIKIRGLSEELSLDEIYLILYSYLKHRGISYLEDATIDENDTGKKSSKNSYAKGLELNENELKTKLPCEIQKERLQNEKVRKYRGTTITEVNGEEICMSNVFTIDAYKREIKKILNKQKEFHSELTDEFIEKFLNIFERKRKYYEGPGNDKSRTDYGRYTTRLQENGDYVTEENIFEKLIGKCSVYKDETRAAAASYTAQEYNVLNDLNNLTINGRKLEEEEKHFIVEKIKTSDSVNMRNIIKSAIGEKVETLTGARVDKDGKEEFHKFKTYNKMRKELKKIGVDISKFSTEELDEIGYILTINKDKETMTEAFTKAIKESKLSLDGATVDCLIALRKKEGKLFGKWHSFSLKVMQELIPAMYKEPKEQMTLLTEMGLMNVKAEQFRGLTYIPIDAVSEKIFNPIVRRSVRMSFRILNALMKKYKEISEIVIEMPRDENSEEEKNFIEEMQKKNAKEAEYIEKKLSDDYGLKLTSKDYSMQKKLGLKLKLWNEQDGICLYSGKAIDPRDIVNNPDMFEIDHIIPRSISFDDSRDNKVLVYAGENQAKDNQTPYYYLTHSTKEWTYEDLKAKVIALSNKSDYPISSRKVQNLLYTEDITKIEVLKGFTNRNLNDTRYASRVVLNTLQSFFKAQESKVKVTVTAIRGSFTHQMRVNMNLNKNRGESYSHHAVDAMLLAYSQLRYEEYRELLNSLVNFETGEIPDEKAWKENMTDDVYEKFMYGMKGRKIRNKILSAEQKIKYWHFVDKKCNRTLCNQTIRGTREYDGKTYKINTLDIRNKNGYATFKKIATSTKESEKERLLIYRKDRKTFDMLLKIMHDYECKNDNDEDEKDYNPFVEYEKDTGDYVRKYAKKHNGPRIGKLKYIDGEVGSCIDISHKYGFAKDSKKVILESLKPYRMDVYYKEENQTYYLVGIKQSDIKCVQGTYMIDEEAYAKILLAEKMIAPGQSRKDLESLGYEFQMSFYENDIIKYEKNNDIYRERFLSRTMPKQKNYIETKPIDREKFEKRKLVNLEKTKLIQKYTRDILGNYYLCGKEEFSIYC